MIIVIQLKLSKFKYINNYMLIYVKNFKINQSLKIFYMHMPKCPLYTSCKYFQNWIKFEHLRAKEGFKKIFCKQILNGQGNLMCNKVNTDLNPINKFFISDNLTYLLSTHRHPLKLFLLIKFSASFSKCLNRQEIALLKEGLGL